MPCLFGFVKESVLLKALLSSDRRDIDTNKFCKLDFCRVALAQFNQFHILEGVSKNNGNPKSSILIGFFQYKPSILVVFPLFLVQHPYRDIRDCD